MLNNKLNSFTFEIKTMGCKANIYDSMVLEKELMELGGSFSPESPDVFILNSCTVTAQADKQVRHEIAKIKKRSLKTWSLVAGCHAQVASEQLRKSDLVDEVVINKKDLKRIIAEKFGLDQGSSVSQAKDEDIYWGQLPLQTGKTRAFLKVQEGCNDFCTYCIIPFARGKSRSIRMGDVLSEIQRLVDCGIKEVILTGINLADYGKDFDSSLEALIQSILKHTRLARLRISSLDPSEISDELLMLMKNESRIMPHFHISLQSPVSQVLRAMKRTYRAKEVEECLNKIHHHHPNAFIGMDVIAGFPSETSEAHEETMQTLSQLPWTRLHVFPYSERQGTPALKIKPSVPMQERKRRAQALLSLSHQRHEMFAKQYINRKLKDVLFENFHSSGDDYFVLGYTPNYLRVLVRVPSRTLEEAQALRNQIRAVHSISLTPKPAEDWTIEASLHD